MLNIIQKIKRKRFPYEAGHKKTQVFNTSPIDEVVVIKCLIKLLMLTHQTFLRFKRYIIHYTVYTRNYVCYKQLF